LKWASVSVRSAAALIVVFTVVATMQQASADQTLTPSLTPVGNTVAGTFPTNPTNLATDNGILADDIVSMGYTIGCVAEAPPYRGILATLVRNAQKLAFTSVGFDPEQLAACNPDGIITGASRATSSAGAADKSIAPTAFIGQPNPPLNASSSAAAASTWKTWLFNVAAAMGGSAQQRAAVAVANDDRQAAALRGLVSGTSVAFIGLQSGSTFFDDGNYIPAVTVYREDLGMKNVQLPASAYSTPCDQPGTTPASCSSNVVSDEYLPDLDSADIVLLYLNTFTSATIQAFDADPLFEGITAVKAGRWAQGVSLTTVGPTGVSNIYSAIASILKITQYSASVKRGTGATASLALDASSGKACWAIDPTPGKGKPAGTISLTTTPKPGLTLTLSTKPRYFDPEARSDPQGGNSWETSPPTYETDGCVTVPSAFEKAWLHSPSNVHLVFDGANATLKHGVPSPVYQAP
jgi:ABC-type Fe3+-hydroxamate transport system substrate-binding protein